MSTNSLVLLPSKVGPNYPLLECKFDSVMHSHPKEQTKAEVMVHTLEN